MANEPITREEILLNAVATGEQANIKPITREEMFLAKLGGAEVSTPTPITRKEQFLQKAIENGGGPGGGGNTGGDDGWIGDGNTHIWITLTEGRTSPMLGVCPNGTVTVDWGDGTTPDVLTGTSTSSVVWTPTHEYAKAGDYVITLTVDGEMGLSGTNSQKAGACILRHLSGAHSINAHYQSAVRKVEIGGSTKLNGAAFCCCASMESIKIPEGIASLKGSTFYMCYSLKSVTIPKSVTELGNEDFSNCESLMSVIFLGDTLLQIGTNTFAKCHRLSSVAFPKTVNSMNYGTFNYNYGIRYIDFSASASVPALISSNGIATNAASDFEIRVPAALYDEWISATNWATCAANIVAV